MSSKSKSRSRSVAAAVVAAADDGRASDESDAENPTDSLAVGEKIMRGLDPLDPRKVALDVFEAYCHEMLNTKFVERRAFLIQKLKYMISRLIGHQYAYGRVYNRTLIANLMSRVCGRHAYVVPEELEEGGGQSYRLQDCLVDFDSKKWAKTFDDLQVLARSMLRKDASLIVLPTEIDLEDAEEIIPEADEEINEELRSQDAFTKGYERIVDLMKFHMCLSHLQPSLATALRTGSYEGAESVVISNDDIIAFEEDIEDQFGADEDSKYACILNDMLEVNKRKNRSTRYGGLRLKPFSEIKQICDDHRREFDLELFQGKFHKLLLQWTALVLPVPELSKLGYGSLEDDSDGVARKPMAAVNDKENVQEPDFDIGVKKSAKSRPQQQPKQLKRRDDRKPSAATAKASSFDAGGDDDDLVDSSSEGENEGGAFAADLKRKRNALMKRVEDPLDKCVELAQKAKNREIESESEDESDDGDDAATKGKGRKLEESDSSEDEKEDAGGAKAAVKRPNFREKKKSAKQLVFTDSEDSEGEGVELSDLPARRRPAAASKRTMYAPQEIHVSQRTTTGKKRKRFTQEEDRAIREGVERFGTKWSDIKGFYPMELKDRDQGAIRTRWRDILSKGKA